MKANIIKSPINKFDPEVEAEADRLWKERGHEEYYLIEWKHLTRPFPEQRCGGDSHRPAVQTLADAEAIVRQVRAG